MRRLSVLLLLLVPLAAGCGSETAALQGSDDALRDASTSRVEWKMEGKAMPSFRSTGSIDYANGRGELIFTGGAGPETRAVFVGRDGYFGAKVGDTMYWVKGSGESTRAADRFLPGASGMSPDRLMKDLIKASTKVDKVDSEEIRGVSTTHYRAHLDGTKLGLKDNAEVPDAVDAWIDEQGLPRRVRVPYGRDNEVAEVVDLFDFGVPVDVEAPPANEIVSEKEFEKMMDKECAGAGEHLEDANPLCWLFTATISASDGSDSVQISPTETVPTTEGK